MFLRAWQRTRRSLVRLIPTVKNVHVSTQEIERKHGRTSCYSLPILIHERIPRLEKVILQSIKTPQRFVIELLALVRRVHLVQKLLSGSCPALWMTTV